MTRCKAASVSILLVASLGASGCVRYAYYVERETPQDLARVRSASQIWAHELVVSFTPPPEWEFPEDRWMIIEADLKQWYAAWIVARVGSSERTVTVLTPDQDQAVVGGVFLETDLTKIDKGSHGWTGMGVGMTKNEVGWATISFRDDSGRLLYQSDLMMDSSIGSSDGGFGFRDRVKWFMWHCANAVRDLMEQGELGEGARNQGGKH